MAGPAATHPTAPWLLERGLWPNADEAGEKSASAPARRRPRYSKKSLSMGEKRIGSVAAKQRRNGYLYDETRLRGPGG